MKKNIVLVTVLLALLIIPFKTVEAATNPCNGMSANQKCEFKTICSKSKTDGLLFSGPTWEFSLFWNGPESVKKNPNYYSDSNIGYNFQYLEGTKICPSTGCAASDKFFIGKTGGTLTKGGVFSTVLTNSTLAGTPHPNFANIGEEKKVSGALSAKEIYEMAQNGECPAYVYIASNLDDQKVGFIFSNKKIDNTKSIFEKYGYIVLFEEAGSDTNKAKETRYLNYIKELKGYIDTYKNNHWGLDSSENDNKCDSQIYKGTDDPNFNVKYEYFLKYRDEYKATKPSYNNWDADEKIAKEFANLKCVTYKPGLTPALTPTPEYVNGCELIPTDLKNWMNTVLNVVKYLSLALVIILGVMDFLKATASHDDDALKKSGKTFMIRLVAVIILFLLPVIIELILNFAAIPGVTVDNETCGVGK